ncbi:hypothetical protein WG907_12465 [Sphingobium sp. AN558]|uniref:hypothetical protein n=1 Tax=Sphingobium sp. AN558 TaxID=3133442 RepID=UPI0030BECD56
MMSEGRFDINQLMDPVVEDPYIVDLEFPFQQFVTLYRHSTMMLIAQKQAGWF